MTFLEAAVEVLKREGQPLSAKRLAELSVQRNLLSVVGRDPAGTMQARLADALEKRMAADLIEVKPGLYGLRSYPAPSELPAAPAVVAAAPVAANGGEASRAEEAGGRRRRRRRRGGRAGEPVNAAGSPGDEAEEGEEAEGADEKTAAEPAAPMEPVKSAVAASPASPAPTGAAGEEGRRRRRRGGRGRKREGAAPTPAGQGATAAEDHEDEDDDVAHESPQNGVTAHATDGQPDADADADSELELTDLTSGPLLTPLSGDEEMTRSGDERTVRPEIQGRRSDRDQRRHHERRPQGQGQPQHGRHHNDQRPRPAPPSVAAPAPAAASAIPTALALPAPPRNGLLEAGLELLRSGDGRPMHVRHMAELAAKRRLVDGRLSPGDLTRQLRMALIGNERRREAAGRRPRVRGLGAGQFTLGDRRVEPELRDAEHALDVEAERLRHATMSALVRRLGRLAPPSFETMVRALLSRLAVDHVEQVKRGDGVVYLGGTRTAGTGTVRTLVAVRAGAEDLSRRAVAELRAGLAARGFDEGWLLSSARLSAEATAELAAGPGVIAYDGAQLAVLLCDQGIGVRKLTLPVAYLDVELFAELAEG